MSTGSNNSPAALEICTRCGGAGNIPCFAHVDGGCCFACEGTGYIADAPRKLPRGHVAGTTVQAGKFGAIFVHRAPKGHLIATNARGEGVPFILVDGVVTRCDWFSRYNGRTDALFAAMQAARS